MYKQGGALFVILLMANIILAQQDCFEYSVNNELDVYNAQIAEVDHFSGSSLDVAVEGDIAFHVSGDGLIRAYDVSTPDVPILLDTEVVGQLFGAPDSYRAAKIGVDGSRVFVAWIGSSYPTEVKINKYVFSAGAFNLQGTFQPPQPGLCLVVDAIGAEDGLVALCVGNEFSLADMSSSDPASWTVLDVSQYGMGAEVVDLAMNDGLLWLSAGQGGLHCFDVAEPEAPVLIGHLGLAEGVYSCSVVTLDGRWCYFVGRPDAGEKNMIYEAVVSSGGGMTFVGSHSEFGTAIDDLAYSGGVLRVAAGQWIIALEPDGVGDAEYLRSYYFDDYIHTIDSEMDIIHVLSNYAYTIHERQDFGYFDNQQQQVVGLPAFSGVELIETADGAYAAVGGGNYLMLDDGDEELHGVYLYSLAGGGIQLASMVDTDCVTDIASVQQTVAVAVGHRFQPASHGIRIFSVIDGQLVSVQDKITFPGLVVESIEFDADQNLYACVGDDLKIFERTAGTWVEAGSLDLNPDDDHESRPVDVVTDATRIYVARGWDGLTVLRKEADPGAPTVVLAQSQPMGNFRDLLVVEQDGTYICAADSSGTQGDDLVLVDPEDGQILDNIGYGVMPASGPYGNMHWSGRYIYKTGEYGGFVVLEVDDGDLSIVGPGFAMTGVYTTDVTGFGDHILVTSFDTEWFGWLPDGLLQIHSRQCGDFTPSEIRYTNVSEFVSGLDYAGSPYSAVPFDLGGSYGRSMFVSTTGHRGQLYRSDPPQNGVPQFFNITGNVFVNGNEPATSLRGLSAVDYDNDGLTDLLVCGDAGGALYRNTGSQLVDVTAGEGLTAALEHSWMGVWGDYDRDGLVDLFICRAGDDDTADPDPSGLTEQVSRLFRNTGDGFVDVTAAAGLPTSATPSIAAAWGDADDDGDLDLWVGSYDAAKVPLLSYLYLNQDDGTFINGYGGAFPDDPAAVNGAIWADVDNDADLDLIVGSRLGENRVYINHPVGSFNGVGPLQPAAGVEASGLAILDHDLDGRTDIVLSSATRDPVVLENREHYAGPVFLDQTKVVDFTGEGPARGFAITDANGDGDPDLFVGRPLASQEFYYVVEENPAWTGRSDPPSNDWVGIRLEASAANNASCIGAKVIVTLPNNDRKVLAVDGGRGCGGQGDYVLVCGLGDDAPATVDVEVRWPGRFAQFETVPVNTVTTIQDLTAPEILEATVDVSITGVPDGPDIWTFRWETDVSSDRTLDWVEVTQPGQSVPTLVQGATTYRAAVGAGYVHEIEVALPCVVGMTTYRVGSGVANRTDVSDHHDERIRFCFTN